MGLGMRLGGSGPWGAFLRAQEESPTLVLANAGLDDEGAMEIASFLGPSHHMLRLDLSGNAITSVGITHLARSLQMNGMIESLVLRHNRIAEGGEAGLAALCRALAGHRSLRHLDLRHNGLAGALAAKCLGEMLQSNSHLTHLELSWNPLDPAGGQVLLEHVTANTTLFDCQLTGCSIAAETLMAIANVLLRNRKAKGADMQAGPYRGLRSERDEDGRCHGEAMAECSPKPDWQRTKELMDRLRLVQAAGDGRADGADASAWAQELHEHLERYQGELDRESRRCGEIHQRTDLAITGFQDRELRYRSDIAAAREKVKEYRIEAEELRGIRLRQSQELEVLQEACGDARESLERSRQHHELEEARSKTGLATVEADRRELAEHLEGLQLQSLQKDRDIEQLRLRAEKVRSGVIILQR
mmetsp:Transcript_19877/g.40416  ORF Transcript_19877/g.40416 Transcript_19877/m.40416 type:complete len:416 (-) Transcript_19877:123-1370(-)